MPPPHRIPHATASRSLYPLAGAVGLNLTGAYTPGAAHVALSEAHALITLGQSSPPPSLNVLESGVVLSMGNSSLGALGLGAVLEAASVATVSFPMVGERILRCAVELDVSACIASVPAPSP